MYYLLTFNHVSKSGKKKNYSLFENEKDFEQFLIQLIQCSNIEVISCQKVDLQIKHDFDLCNFFHGSDGLYEVKNDSTR